jgi:hypothetical protein
LKPIYSLAKLSILLVFLSLTGQAYSLHPSIHSTAKQISFRENKGQVRDQNFKPRQDVLFSGATSNFGFYLKNDGLHYQLSRIDSWKKSNQASVLEHEEPKLVPDLVSIYRVDINWVGANKNAKIEKGDALEGYDNYYNVPEGVEPALFVKSYTSLTYKNIYNGIDLKFYESQNGDLEYDFLVQPNADYRQIALEIKGAEISVNDKQELIIKTPFGNIIEGALAIYQDERKIAGNWMVEGQTVRFSVTGLYDQNKPLRIDPPVRVWGTYVGGSDVEYAYGCAVDNQKRSFTSGFTYSNNMATTGAHQTSIAGVRDAFLSSFAEWGTRRWSTYLGGNLDDVAYSCEATPNGEAYIGGFAQSTSGISTNGAHQPSQGDAGTFVDGFVSKFDTSGVILWSTYLGGSWQDEVKAMALDTAGNLFITGYTQSSDNISTPGVYNPNYSGSKDVFLVKMSASGSVLWGTYFGESNDDEATGCAVRNGKVAITGITNSTIGIATMGAHQNSLQGPKDIFVAVFDTIGQLDWATYYGGTLTEEGGGVALDSLGNVYVSGTTWSSSDISTTGAFQSSFAGGTMDAFLVKFSDWGERLWGTYLGGQGNDEGLYCHVDPFGDIYFGGTTSSSSGIASPGAYKTIKGTSSNPTAGDAFFAKFSTNGSRIWSTYYGGEGGEVSYDLATDTAGNIFITGLTSSDQLLASENFSHQKFRGGFSDAFLIRFNNNMITLPEIPTSVIDARETETNFYLYPNPATNLVWLKTENVDDYTLRIFDIQGKLTEQHQFENTQSFSLNTSDLSNGVYFLQISNNKYSATKRLIIQH